MRNRNTFIEDKQSVSFSTVCLLCALVLATFAVASHAADFANSLGMKFIRIGPNKFQMGSPDAFRTGEFRASLTTRDPKSPGEDLPDTDDPARQAVFYVDDASVSSNEHQGGS